MLCFLRRCLVFTIRDLKPRGPRGCFKIMKAARIDTRANMRDRFIVWEPMPHGKVKVRCSLLKCSMVSNNLQFSVDQYLWIK